MAAYESFLPHVLPYVPACFEPQAVTAVRNACIDFCRDSLVLQQDMTAINVVAGNNTYTVAVPTGYVLSQVLSLYYKGARMERKSQLELERLYTRDWQSLAGTPRVFTQLTPDTITVALNPSEQADSGLTGRIAITPTRTSTDVNDLVLERYLDEIANGAIARLKLTPDQPYTDPAGAMAYRALFIAGTNRARAFVNGGMNHAPMRVRLQRIW
ncbi:MAG: hypothetical protein RJA99_3187 [Pseudomonadota bacterium]|jgi:hypothetical protein